MTVSDESNLYSREELLSDGPAPTRRARVILFAIESRTAHLKEKSGRFSSSYLSPRTDEEREEVFLEALGTGRHPTLLPTIQDVERYVLYWSSLVSDLNANLRAGLARVLGQKYKFNYSAVPGIRKALGLDEEIVKQEYRRLFGDDLSALYVVKPYPVSRLRWLQAGLAKALEALPPFWIAFALTLPIGPSLLAIPIAVAEIGAIPGIALTVFFGIINAFTVASLAETVARSGTTRFGIGYIGQLVSEYIGKAGSFLLTVTLAINSVLVLIAYYLGVAGTLAQLTGIPSTVWIALLFITVVYFLSRKSLNITVASAIIITFIKLALVISISVSSLPYIHPANLQHMELPFSAMQPFNPSVLQLVFGVMLANYCSHLAVANYGRVVIRRDPSARSWIWGSVAAIGLTMLVSCLWIITFNGAIPAKTLAQEAGTAVTALARYVGPIISWLGAIFVILSVGLACIHISLGLLFLVRERLPKAPTSQVGKKVHFFICISPVVAIFLISEWMTFSGLGSFAKLLSIVGGLALPVLGGIFPLFLLAASRRKGDFVPGTVLKFIGHPAVLVGLYLIFLGSVFLYGIFIWENLLERVVSIALGTVIFTMTIAILRRKILNTRVVVELREDLSPGGINVLNITACGRSLETEVSLDYGDFKERHHTTRAELVNFPLLRVVTIRLPATGAKELKVWVHQITPDLASVGLPALVKIKSEGGTRWVPLKLSEAQILVDFDGRAFQLEISVVGPKD